MVAITQSNINQTVISNATSSARIETTAATTSATTRTTPTTNTIRSITDTRTLSERITKIRDYNRVTEQMNSKFCSEFNTFPKLTEIMRLSRRKNYFKISNQQQRKIRHQAKAALIESSQFLKNMGLCLSSVEINPLENECDLKMKINTARLSETKQPNKNNLLFFKDKHSVSRSFRSEISLK